MFETCIRPYNLRPSASRFCVSHDKVNSPCTYHTNMFIPTAHRGPSRHSLAAMSTIKTLTIPEHLLKSSPLYFFPSSSSGDSQSFWPSASPTTNPIYFLYQTYPSTSHTPSPLSFATMWAPPSPPWAANPPPDQERHEGYYPGTSTSVIGVGLFATILSVIVVCMRLYSRVFSVRGLKADDRESKYPTLQVAP